MLTTMEEHLNLFNFNVGIDIDFIIGRRSSVPRYLSKLELEVPRFQGLCIYISRASGSLKDH